MNKKKIYICLFFVFFFCCKNHKHGELYDKTFIHIDYFLFGSFDAYLPDNLLVYRALLSNIPEIFMRPYMVSVHFFLPIVILLSGVLYCFTFVKGIIKICRIIYRDKNKIEENKYNKNFIKYFIATMLFNFASSFIPRYTFVFKRKKNIKFLYKIGLFESCFYKKPLKDDDVFDKVFKEVNIEKNTEIKEKECVICLCALDGSDGEKRKDNTVVKSICCTHSYHKECIRGWWVNKHECPTCREKIEWQGGPMTFLDESLLLTQCFIEFSIRFDNIVKFRNVMDYISYENIMQERFNNYISHSYKFFEIILFRAGLQVALYKDWDYFLMPYVSFFGIGIKLARFVVFNIRPTYFFRKNTIIYQQYKKGDDSRSVLSFLESIFDFIGFYYQTFRNFMDNSYYSYEKTEEAEGKLNKKKFFIIFEFNFTL